MIKKYLFELTPLGKADKEVRDYLKEGLEPHQFERYENALNHYRHMKIIQASLKMLFYASIITSVATTVGFDEAQILQRIASYIGKSLIFILFAITSYISMIRRETYHVQREILISKAEW
jgi:hypothetical protein